MQHLLDELQRLIDLELHNAALITAVTIPDVCACLLSPTGNTKGRNERSYSQWCDLNFKQSPDPNIPTSLYQDTPPIDGASCYAIRCGILHENNARGFVFMITSKGQWHMHGCEAHGKMQLDALKFCQDMHYSATLWYQANRTTPVVQNNLRKVVMYREDGLSPFFVGMPVIC